MIRAIFGNDSFFKVENMFYSNGDRLLMVITDGVGLMQKSICAVMVFE